MNSIIHQWCPSGFNELILWLLLRYITLVLIFRNVITINYILHLKQSMCIYLVKYEQQVIQSSMQIAWVKESACTVKRMLIIPRNKNQMFGISDGKMQNINSINSKNMISFRVFQDGNSVIHACFSALIESGVLWGAHWGTVKCFIKCKISKHSFIHTAISIFHPTYQKNCAYLKCTVADKAQTN